MKSTIGILLALVSAVAAVEGIFLVQVNERVDRLERRIRGSEESPAASPLALGGEVRELEERQTDTAAEVQAVRQTVATLTERVEGIDLAAKESIALRGVEGSGAPSPAELRDVVQATVEETVDRKLDKLPKGGGGEWKPAMRELEEYLSLTEQQTERAQRIIDDAKHEAFQLLSIRRTDGTCKMDDLVTAFTHPDEPEAKAKEVFASLFTEKIPGRDEPYIAEILRITSGAEKTLKSVLDENQRKKLSRVNLDYLGIKTDYDPFAEYVQESMR